MPNMIPHIHRHLLLALLAFPVLATIHLPTGEYRASATDLRVKVRGGEVVIQRTWQADDLSRGQFRWHPDPAWDDLRFEMSAGAVHAVGYLAL